MLLQLLKGLLVRLVLGVAIIIHVHNRYFVFGLR
jgi:hypothetical protein